MAQRQEHPVRSAEASVYSYATEDIEKVKKALSNALDGVEAEEEDVKLTGHYEDPIISITAEVTGRKESTEILARIFSSLSILERAQVIDELPDRVDSSGNLYLRLDKQELLQGKIRLTEGDPVRIKFKVPPPHRAGPVEYVRGVLRELEEEEGE